jgi:hypothetical protein
MLLALFLKRYDSHVYEEKNLERYGHRISKHDDDDDCRWNSFLLIRDPSFLLDDGQERQ